MSNKITLDYNQALALWKEGWCWNAVAKEYNCCKATVKKRVGENCDITEEDREMHHKRHNRYCPVCRKERKIQEETLF